MFKASKKLVQKNKSNHFWLVFFITLILFLIGCYASLRFGAINFKTSDLITVLKNPLKNSNAQDVIFDIRLPRIIAAILVGAAMSQAGAIMQGVTRNAIADPGLLGINAGAGLALVVAYAFLGSMHYSTILIVCLLGSVISCLLVFTLSYTKQKGYHQLRLILAGAMISTLFTSVGQVVTLYFKLNRTVIGWQAGGLSQINWKMLIIIAPIIILGLLISQLLAHQLTILSLNESVAKALGQKTQLMTAFLLLIVLFLSASSVALIGTVSFIGLIIPHFIKLFILKDYRLLLPLIGFSGATFMIWVDLSSRIINPPSETPISSIISIVGLPCFLWLIRKGKNL
ncbi:TPA: FecCD family ABC transporter permease [Streptococcus agalactiae]